MYFILIIPFNSAIHCPLSINVTNRRLHFFLSMYDF